MDHDTQKLRLALQLAGLSKRAIDAAWPSWWSDAASESPSAQAELRFTLARNLGLSAKSLVGERVEFVWKDTARFKHLTGETAEEQATLTSFGIAVGRLLLRATSSGSDLTGTKALALRVAVLRNRPFVDLSGLLALCWGVGIPVAHLRVFPLATKSMHAMVVKEGDRYAVLLSRDARYPAPVAFTLAHEIGHVALSHISNASALVDITDPALASEKDEEESSADRYALALLTGDENPEIRTNTERFGAKELARAASEVGPSHGIEPGTLALCLGFRTKRWPTAIASLRHIYSEARPVWRYVNKVAEDQLKWSELTDDSLAYLRNVMGLKNG